MVAGGIVAKGETDGERLVVVRLGHGGRVQLARLLARLEPHDEFGPGERQQIAHLSCVDEVARIDRPGAAGFRTLYLDRADARAFDVGRGGLVAAQHGELARSHIRRKRRFDDGKRHPWLVRQHGDRSAPWIQAWIVLRLARQRIVVPVVAPDRFTVGAVSARRAKRFDPGMFVWRDGLRGELAADPVCLFREDDFHAGAQGGQRGGASARAAADHGDVAADGVRGGPSRGRNGDCRKRLEECAAGNVMRCHLHTLSF